MRSLKHRKQPLMVLTPKKQRRTFRSISRFIFQSSIQMKAVYLFLQVCLLALGVRSGHYKVSRHMHLDIQNVRAYLIF